MATEYIVRSPDGATPVTGPFAELADAQAFAAGQQAAGVAESPGDRRPETSTDSLTYVVMQTTVTTRDTNGIQSNTSYDSVVASYLVELLAPPPA
jgi:hypothetical protein